MADAPHGAIEPRTRQEPDTRREESPPAWALLAARIDNRLLVVLAFVAGIWFLRASYAVTMPLAFAVFLVALAWPIQQWLHRRLPPGLSFVGTLLAMFLVLAIFFAGIYFSIGMIAEQAPEYTDEFQEIYESIMRALERIGVPQPQEGAVSRLTGALQSVATGLWHGAGLFLFIVALVILGLPAVPQFQRKIERGTADGGDKGVLKTVGRIATAFQRYIATSTLTSFITGVLTWLITWAVGLDFALVWGVLSFLLNYVPTIGSIIAVFPPALFALVQFDEYWKALVVLLGLGVMQTVMGNYVYPMLQGRSLSVSPVVLLFSIAFWGWVWGIPGALLAVPLTSSVIIVCQQFPQTRLIAELLAEERGGNKTKGGPD
jgi:predicted PurR-regulated permease PerM